MKLLNFFLIVSSIVSRRLNRFGLFLECWLCLCPHFRQLSERILHCLKKHPRHFSCNLSKHFPIWLIFGTNVTQRLSNQRRFIFPTSPKQCFCTTLHNRQTQKLHSVFLRHSVVHFCRVQAILWFARMFFELWVSTDVDVRNVSAFAASEACVSPTLPSYRARWAATRTPRRWWSAKRRRTSSARRTRSRRSNSTSSISSSPSITGSWTTTSRPWRTRRPSMSNAESNLIRAASRSTRSLVHVSESVSAAPSIRHRFVRPSHRLLATSHYWCFLVKFCSRLSALYCIQRTLCMFSLLSTPTAVVGWA